MFFGVRCTQAAFTILTALHRCSQFKQEQGHLESNTRSNFFSRLLFASESITPLCRTSVAADCISGTFIMCYQRKLQSRRNIYLQQIENSTFSGKSVSIKLSFYPHHIVSTLAQILLTVTCKDRFISSICQCEICMHRLNRHGEVVCR